jgi:orotidine-5'-phosphate decarboxylase
MIDAKERLILAIDVDTLSKTTALVEALAPHVGYFKIGLELLMSAGAPQAIQHLHRLGAHLFVDAKLHDIPNTVGAASRALSSMGIKMFDVHASAGKEAMQAAVENKGHADVLAVTILTSFDDETCMRLYGQSASDATMRLAHEAAEAGVDGLICSAQDLERMSQDEKLKPLLKLCPGIRPTWAEAQDQKRTLTPSEAIRAGASHVILGRPVLNPPMGIGTPIDAIQKVVQEIAQALS